MKKNIPLIVAGCDFKISVEDEKHNRILEAAHMVEDNINQIKKHGGTVGSDKVAILAAINIANNLLKFTQEKNYLSENSEATIDQILTDIDSTLEKVHP